MHVGNVMFPPWGRVTILVYAFHALVLSIWERLIMLIALLKGSSHAINLGGCWFSKEGL